jgi:hypothetical protein
MILELDPDVWLYARLSLGRGWNRAVLVGLWTSATLLVATSEATAGFVPRMALGLAIPVALLLLVIAPINAVARLFDLELGGLLDQTRLCGRRPWRILAAFLAGSTGPWLLAAGGLLAGYAMRRHHWEATFLPAVLAFSLALAVALTVYSTLPPSMAPDSRFVRPLLFLFGIAVVSLLGLADLINALSVTAPERAATAGAAALILPAAWLACRRVLRPAQDVHFGRLTVREMVRRVIPISGPPEFSRQFRRTLLSGGTLATIVAVPIGVVVIVLTTQPDRYGAREGVLNIFPLIGILIGGYAASTTAGAEIELGTMEFVRLTAQRPLTVAASWYVAFATPFWLTTAVAVAALVTIEPGALALHRTPMPLLLAVAWPAVCLAEGIQRRRPGSYALLPIATFYFVGGYLDVQNAQFSYPYATELAEWVDPRAVFGLLLVGGSVAAAAGRIRSAEGPSLSVPSMLFVTTGLCILATLPIAGPLGIENYEIPRVAAGMLALFGGLAAEESAVPTPPWKRLLVVPGAAILVAAMGSYAGLHPDESAAMGVASGLALAAAIVGHELVWRVAGASILLRFAILLALQRSPWQVYRWAHLDDFITRRYTIPWIPAMIDGWDIAALTAALAALLVLHARTRRHAYTSRPWPLRASPTKP